MHEVSSGSKHVTACAGTCLLESGSELPRPRHHEDAFLSHVLQALDHCPSLHHMAACQTTPTGIQVLNFRSLWNLQRLEAREQSACIRRLSTDLGLVKSQRAADRPMFNQRSPYRRWVSIGNTLFGELPTSRSKQPWSPVHRRGCWGHVATRRRRPPSA